MDQKRNKTIAVIFGGRSAEHEVSIITAHQAMDALKVAGYKLLPLYITKSGEWYAGDGLYNLRFFSQKTPEPASAPNVSRVSLSPDPSIRELIHHPNQGHHLFRSRPKLWADVFFPIVHGTTGEDGAIEGLLEMANVPYVGSGISASATGFDKILMKAIFANAGLPVLQCLPITRSEWKESIDACIAKVLAKFSFPVIVKPSSLGSSIGVRRCTDSESLGDALDLALRLDSRALVEKALTGFIELNCSVIGPPYKASVCEQPILNDAILSFDSKYKRGAKGAKAGNKNGMASLGRLLPAPIREDLAAKVKDWAIAAFELLGCAGVARVDFLYVPDEDILYVNEINTIPGSLSFYLWEFSGLPFESLVEKLIDISLAIYTSKQETEFSFGANLLFK
jgi:D-alanine-D-alanine ligase